MIKILLSIIIGYLLGIIQASYLLSKAIKKVDIRTLGFGNAGMSNAVESLGWKFGLLVGFIDVGKGILSILLIKSLFQIDFNPSGSILLYLNAYSVILGHIYPFHMNFKGQRNSRFDWGFDWIESILWVYWDRDYHTYHFNDRLCCDWYTCINTLCNWINRLFKYGFSSYSH